MLSSMSMSSSLQLARECLQAEQAPKAETPAEQLSPFEGIQMFAQTIESSKQYFQVFTALNYGSYVGGRVFLCVKARLQQWELCFELPYNCQFLSYILKQNFLLKT